MWLSLLNLHRTTRGPITNRRRLKAHPPVRAAWTRVVAVLAVRLMNDATERDWRAYETIERRDRRSDRGGGDAERLQRLAKRNGGVGDDVGGGLGHDIGRSGRYRGS
jgi:hypothetical protein